jgi:molybdopterin-containing oxidoreductase family membrane subunit
MTAATIRKPAAGQAAGPAPAMSPAAPKGIKIAWYVFLAIALLVGGGATVYRLVMGLEATNLSSPMPWGAWVAFYIYFVGLSAGAFLLSSLIYVFGMTRFEKVGKTALLTALVCMIVALAFIGLDLGRWERALIPLLRFNWLSPLAWEVRFYIIYIALLAGELFLAVRGREQDHQWLRILGTVGIPIAIFGVHGGTGTIFAVVKARGMWSGPLAPIVFIVSALVSGTALLTAMYAIRQRARRLPVDGGLIVDLGKLLMGFLIVDAGLMFYEFLVPGLSMNPHENEVIRVMATGRMAWSFWIVQLGLGIVGPLVILMSGLKRHWQWVAAAAAMVVVGIVGVRFNIVVPALIPPVLEGLPRGDYAPTLVEWLSSAGLIAIGLLLFSLGAEWLPLDANDGGADHVG